jgi:CheY-like chemotaxis protein
MNEPVLLVEDEENDVFFMRMAFERAGVKNPLVVASDGREAISYLNGDGKFGDRHQHPIPCLVLLDLRLPQVPGLEVLRWIRQQPSLNHLPVIVCSSSGQDSDVKTSHRLGASAYIIKPSRPAELLEVVRRIKQYWLDRNGPAPEGKDWLSIAVRS